MLTVSTALSDDRASALSLLFRQSADSERDAQVAEMLTAADRGDISLEGLLTARDGGTIQAAGLYVEQAANVFWSRPRGPIVRR